MASYVSVQLGTVSYLVKTYHPSEETQVNHQILNLMGVGDTTVENIRPGWSELRVGYVVLVVLAENVSSITKKSHLGWPSNLQSRLDTSCSWSVVTRVQHVLVAHLVTCLQLSLVLYSMGMGDLVDAV